jgi:hypothetical protein
MSTPAAPPIATQEPTIYMHQALGETEKKWESRVIGKFELWADPPRTNLPKSPYRGNFRNRDTAEKKPFDLC